MYKNEGVATSCGTQELLTTSKITHGSFGEPYRTLETEHGGHMKGKARRALPTVLDPVCGKLFM